MAVPSSAHFLKLEKGAFEEVDPAGYYRERHVQEYPSTRIGPLRGIAVASVRGPVMV